MSWIEKINKDFSIQTGDGKVYSPSWMNAKRDVTYQVKEFNFIGVKGSLVNRQQPSGQKFVLEIYFQGDDHLEEAEAFKTSADDPRYWILNHPFYDLVNVQPLSLTIDNSKYNTSKVVVPVIETIIDENPKTELIIEDKIEEDTDIINDSTAAKFANDVTPDAADKRTMTNVVDALNKNTITEIKEEEDSQDFTNKVNTAKNNILDATENPSLSMQAIYDVVQKPALLQQDLASRLIILKRNLLSYKSTISSGFETLQDMPKSYKDLYEVIGSSIITSLLLATTKPFSENDYASRTDVADTAELIISSMNQYLEDLDEMQVGSGGDLEDYLPDGEALLILNNLVGFTVANLLTVAIDAKQERSLILEDNSDIISLSHRLYGLEKDDSTIDELIRLNSLGLKHMLNIEKGTQITYLV